MSLLVNLQVRGKPKPETADLTNMVLHRLSALPTSSTSASFGFLSNDFLLRIVAESGPVFHPELHPSVN